MSNEKFNGFGNVTGRGGSSHSIDCSNCGNSVGGLEVARHVRDDGAATYWLICPVCSYGIVLEYDKRIYPFPKFGDEIEGLPDEVKLTYNEARECMSINALSGCQLLCRKILMHVAVDKCGGVEGESFVNYIDKIVKAGYITPPMKKWVDVIRAEGNNATHKIEKQSETDAKNIINFTTQLLRLVYEMEHKANTFVKPST